MIYKANLNKPLLFLVAVLFLINLDIHSQSRELITLQTNWKFVKENPQGAADMDFDDSGWQDVSIPHDWAISGPFMLDGDGNTGKLPWKGEGWYRKALNIPSTYIRKKVYSDL